MPHIVKSFDIELGKLDEGLARMGGLAERQLAAATAKIGMERA
jgi:phosphate transport system protein